MFIISSKLHSPKFKHGPWNPWKVTMPNGKLLSGGEVFNFGCVFQQTYILQELTAVYSRNSSDGSPFISPSTEAPHASCLWHHWQRLGRTFADALFGGSSHTEPYHQEFQVPKMEVLNLVRLFWGWVFPYISLTYGLYRWVPSFWVPEMFGDLRKVALDVYIFV